MVMFSKLSEALVDLLLYCVHRITSERHDTAAITSTHMILRVSAVEAVGIGVHGWKWQLLSTHRSAMQCLLCHWCGKMAFFRIMLILGSKAILRGDSSLPVR